MTPDEYWDAIARHDQNQLTPQERARYKTVGVFAEAKARERGTSLLPVPWQDPAILPQHLDEEILIVLGLTSLALSNQKSSPPARVEPG